jgi:hypothetical protein
VSKEFDSPEEYTYSTFCGLYLQVVEEIVQLHRFLGYIQGKDVFWTIFIIQSSIWKRGAANVHGCAAPFRAAYVARNAGGTG